MIRRLQTLPDFAARLSETIAWCNGQSIEWNPLESPEIQKRRRLAEKAAQLCASAWRLARYNPLKYFLRWRSKLLFEKAQPGSILPPLAQQLRSNILDPGRHRDRDGRRFPSGRSAQIAIVEAVVSKRAAQLRKLGQYPAKLDNGLRGGKVLLYAPNENLCDGAAEYTSKGFFDVDNIPPWDTWICLFEEYVVSWVPPQLLDLANAGIEVNPEQCILWAPES